MLSYKIKIFFILILIILSGCQSTLKRCVNCAEDLYLWKTAVDTVANSNFPDEEFEAIVHHADFSNAWVTTGNEIHITDDFLHQLTKEQRVAVAAHEIAHLKSGHYYSNMGVSILTSATFSVLNMFVPGLGFAEYLVKPAVVGGFSRSQELEADRLGVGYLVKAEIPPHHLIEVFNIFRRDSVGKSDEKSYFSTHPTTQERIDKIKIFYETP